MNFSSIKFKVIAAILVSLTIGAVGVLYLSNVSYKNNVNLVAKESVRTSEEAFNNLEANDINMLSATLGALMENDSYKELYMAKDKDGLYKATAPLFERLKNDYRITHWYFHNAEPESTNFLRVHKPEKTGDVINRVTYTNSVKGKSFAAGKELGKTAFALRVVHPYYNNGNLVGYLELGEEIDHFLGLMKKQTGNDYSMIINKEYLDAQEWASMRESHNLKNDWDAYSNVVVVNSTAKDPSVFGFSGKLEKMPPEGKVLGEVKQGDSVFVKGAFPVYDAAKREVGAVYFLRNITPIYQDMKSMQAKVTAFIVVLMVAILGFLTYVLNSLVIKRLRKLIDVATVVVGGDYETKIVPSAKDEIGQFEALFEQFRVVFVNLVKSVEDKLYEKKGA
jgi:HAMP domain-containing protein